MKACIRFKSFACLLLFVLLSLVEIQAQQSNVNLDWRPHLNTENLTPFSAPLNSPEVLNDRTVIFRLKAPEAKKVGAAGRSYPGSAGQRARTGAYGERT